MAQGEAGARSGSSCGNPFLHHIITSWIRTHAEEFLWTVRMFTNGRWRWSMGVPTFVQMEFRPMREERHGSAWKRPFKFADVFMKVNSPSKYGTGHLDYNIIIEVKTGGFTPGWVDELTELYQMRTTMWGSGSINILVLIARRGEIDRAMQYLTMVGKTFGRGFFFTFPLEPLMDRMMGDLLTVVADYFIDNGSPIWP
ncbi:MAG: hypothetical protein RAK18_05570 [Conexivisphaerales archaeon]|jgi:hypothetical protein|nr:hypothetical protein [Conexivisphaerales archaeon]